MRTRKLETLREQVLREERNKERRMSRPLKKTRCGMCGRAYLKASRANLCCKKS